MKKTILVAMSLLAVPSAFADIPHPKPHMLTGQAAADLAESFDRESKFVQHYRGAALRTGGSYFSVFTSSDKKSRIVCEAWNHQGDRSGSYCDLIKSHTPLPDYEAPGRPMG